MITQTNFNIGLRGKKPKNPFFPLHSRPKPKEKGRVDFGLPPHFYSLDIHAWNSYFQAPISSKSLSSFLSLTLGRNTHTHTQISLKLSQEHSRTHPPSSLKNLEI